MKKSVDKTKIEKNVRRSVAEMVDHIKSQTKTNLATYSSKNDIDNKEIQKIARLVEDSITQAFTQSMPNVLKSI